MAKHIYKGTTIPNFTPPQVGHHYVNTATGEQYISKGTSSAADWALLTPASTETIQDTVGAMLTDTATIDFTYNDPGNTLTADVIPGGVDHDALLNFVSDEHIGHSSVSITAGTGLSGGGDITTSRTLNIANTAVTAASYGSTSQVGTFTVNAQGQLTAAANATITPASIGAQPLDGDLTGLSSLSGTGLVARTASDTYAVRTLTAGTGTSVSNGDGVSGNPTVGLTNTGISATFYGNNAQVPQITFDAQGRATFATNVNISINAAQVQDFTEASQDVIGALFTDSSSVDFTYNDAGNSMSVAVIPGGVDHDALSNFVANEHVNHASVSITAGTGLTGGGDITTNRTLNIATTGVTASSYGSATQVGTFTVNAQGQLTAAANTTIAVTSSNVSDFNEAAQDAVGNILTDSASIDFTYNDGANTITAAVLPAGVDHDSLSGFVANEHINHSSVSISAGTGLTGGGDITTNRTISMPNVGTAGTYGDSGNFPIITTDAQGRVTGVTTQAIGGTPINLTATGAVSTTSNTFSTVGSMTTTPAAGTYLVFFTASANITNDSNGDFSLFINGTERSVCRRNIECLASGATAGEVSGSIAITTIVTVNGAEVVDIRYRENNAGTLSVTERQMIFMRIG